MIIISDRGPDLVIVEKQKKENMSNCGLCRPGVPPGENNKKNKNNEKRDKYLDLARKLKNVMEHENDGSNNYNWCVRNGPPKA